MENVLFKKYRAMKHPIQYLVSLFACLLPFIAIGQAPQKFSYQATIRNASNQLINNQLVGLRISILQGSASGTSVYSETHSTITNTNGLISLQVGSGNIINGDIAIIDWSNGPYFIQSETDPNGGSLYTITSTSQLMSVPYALYAAKAPDQQQLTVSLTGDTLYLQNGGYVIIPSISAANYGLGLTGINAHTCQATNVHNSTLYYGVMEDQQGNLYKTITIGGKEWMTENLKTTIYRNGDPIPNVTNTSQWASTTDGGWCYYNNNAQFDCPYGKMYNWYTVSDPRNVCPTGWHVPSSDEWTSLASYVGIGNEGIAGGQLKSTGTQYWLDFNLGATNETGFSGLPGGSRNNNGTFNYIGQLGYWWTASEGDLDFQFAFFRYLSSQSGEVNEGSSSKKLGMSIRCVRD
jgi:uncharacterized protein (TIGR02145 family)